MKLHALMPMLTIFLASCATVPSDPLPPLPVQCPQLPPLDPIPQDVMGADYLERMRLFLSGKVPSPITFDYSLPPATFNTDKPENN